MPITGAQGWLQYLSKHAFRRMRRMVRGYVVAEARAALLAARPDTTAHAAARRRLTWARHMLRGSDPGLSAVRGFSGWVPAPVMLSLALVAGWSGEVTDAGGESAA